MKFLNHILQPDGTFRAVEVPGPPSFDAWLASWRVFENTILVFTVDVGGVPLPMVTPSALEEYKDAFRDLVMSYSEAWHLCVTAEDRCRAKHFPRLRRELVEAAAQGLRARFDQNRPWDEVFRTAARDQAYWDRYVREPALLFRTASSRKKEQPGGTGSAADLAGEDATLGVAKKRRKGQNQRLKAKVAKLEEEKGGMDWVKPPKGGKDGGKGGPCKDGKGRFVADRSGKPLCFAYKNGECKAVRPKGMAHAWQVCLGAHPAKECRKGRQTE